LQVMEAVAAAKRTTRDTPRNRLEIKFMVSG
jgi:hypothetical protein